MSIRYLTFERVVRIHHELMLEEHQQSVLMAPDKLESAVFRPRSTAFGEDAYPRLSEKAAALLQSIAIAHAFMDGNKRVAFTAMDAFLRLNGIEAEPPVDPAYELVRGVAAGEIREVGEIAERLRELYSPGLD